MSPTVLGYRSGQRQRQQLTWVSRDGRSSVPIGPPGTFDMFSLSDDGSRVILARREGNVANLWSMLLAQGTFNRVTIGPGSQFDPRLSPDGSRVAFGEGDDPSRSPATAELSAASAPRQLFKYPGRMFALDDWSADGAWLLYHNAGEPALLASRVDRPTDPPVAVVRLLTGILDQAVMSPDSRWVAYNARFGYFRPALRARASAFRAPCE
jgi:Tol biopolymer transport system component